MHSINIAKQNRGQLQLTQSQPEDCVGSSLGGDGVDFGNVSILPQRMPKATVTSDFFFFRDSLPFAEDGS
jgi:hypothetical protein